jgi:type III secretion protein U
MSGEKTEAPTAKKIKDARQKGQILKSKEIVSSCIIVILLSLLLSLSSFFIEHFLSLFAYLQDSSLLDFSTAKAKIVPHIWHIALNILLPIIIITILIIVLSHLAQFGFLLSPSSLKPDIKHINPIAGAKKIFSLKNLLEFFKSLLKVIFIGFIVWFVIKGNINFFSTCQNVD